MLNFVFPAVIVLGITVRNSEVGGLESAQSVGKGVLNRAEGRKFSSRIIMGAECSVPCSARGIDDAKMKSLAGNVNEKGPGDKQEDRWYARKGMKERSGLHVHSTSKMFAINVFLLHYTRLVVRKGNVVLFDKSK